MTSQHRKHLIFIAGLSGLIYLLVFTLPFPLSQLYQTIPPVDYAKLTGHSVGGFIAYVVGLGALFGLYIWAIQLTVPGESAEPKLFPWPVFITSAILAGILIFSYPLTAIDLFIYAVRTRGWALYGLNPLATAPEVLPTSDPWLGLAAEWVDAPSPYGPLWEGLSLGAFYLSGGDFLRHLFALKIVATLAYLGCAWLVYKILRQLQPEWAVAGTIAFAWSPLALLESVQNGHNDILMVFFLLAAVWAVVEATRSGRREAGEEVKHRNLEELGGTCPYQFPQISIGILLQLAVCLFLGLSILVKFVTIMVVPFFLLALTTSQRTWLSRLGLIIWYGIIIAVPNVLLMLLLWPGWDRWAVLEAGSQAGRSLLALLVLTLRNPLGLNLAFDLSRNLIFILFGLIYLYCLWQTVRGQRSGVRGQKFSLLLPCSPTSRPLLLASSFLVLFWYVLLAAPVFHAWYLLWFLPLAVLLLPYRPPLKATIVFSMIALFIIPYFETIRVWYPALLENQLLGHLIGVPLLIVPPALALLWPISSSTQSEV